MPNVEAALPHEELVSSPPEKSSGGLPRHQNNFGFMRLGFAVLVVLQHAFFLVDANLGREPMHQVGLGVGLGTVALFGFFVLSGYLITQSWTGNPKLASFLRKRILRIYPGFIVAALFSVFVVGRLGSDHAYYQQFHAVAIVKNLVSLTIPGRVASFAELPVPGILNGSLWTIPAEFACYLLVAAAGLSRLLVRRWLIPVLLLAALAIPSKPIVTALSPWLRMPYSNLLGQFLSLVPFFLAGMCHYLFRDRIRYSRRGALFAAVIVFLCLSSKVLPGPALAIGGSYLLFMFAFQSIPQLERVGERVDLSYGIYLYHWPCQLLILWCARELSPWTLFLASLLPAGVLALGSWWLVEKPSLRLKDSLRPARAA